MLLQENPALKQMFTDVCDLDFFLQMFVICEDVVSTSSQMESQSPQQSFKQHISKRQSLPFYFFSD